MEHGSEQLLFGLILYLPTSSAVLLLIGTSGWRLTCRFEQILYLTNCSFEGIERSFREYGTWFSNRSVGSFLPTEAGHPGRAAMASGTTLPTPGASRRVVWPVPPAAIRKATAMATGSASPSPRRTARSRHAPRPALSPRQSPWWKAPEMQLPSTTRTNLFHLMTFRFVLECVHCECVVSCNRKYIY